MDILRLLISLASLAVTACAIAVPPAKTEYGFPILPGMKALDSKTYTLRFRHAKADANHGQMGFFTFRHSLATPLKLWGFRFEDDGSFRVRFEQCSTFVNGVWQSNLFGYCGTGAKTYELQPNRDYILRVPLGAFTAEGNRGVIQIEGESCTFHSEAFDLALIRGAK